MRAQAALLDGQAQAGIAISLGLLLARQRLRFIWDGQRSHHFWITNAGFCPLAIKVEVTRPSLIALVDGAALAFRANWHCAYPTRT